MAYGVTPDPGHRIPGRPDLVAILCGAILIASGTWLLVLIVGVL
jgi:hypothetical protein